MKETRTPLSEAYDLAMLDLDGVVYIGRDAVAGVVGHLAEAKAAGMALSFVTNNAGRPPGEVAAHLRELGIAAEATDVVTSAQAAARLLAERCGEGSRVFVIGGEGLFQALGERGLVGVQDIDAGPVAVVSGYHPDLRWATIIDGTILVEQGLPWVASNTDRTVPTRFGPGPGTGVLVGAITEFTGVRPTVAGKPQSPLLLETQRRVGGRRPLVIGDRLDTDIEGARNAGFDSLLVMTGVTGLAELVRCPARRRPDYVAADLGALLRSQSRPTEVTDAWRCGEWVAHVERGRLEVSPSAEAPAGDADEATADRWWQVVAASSWHHLDQTGDPVDTSELQAPSAA